MAHATAQLPLGVGSTYHGVAMYATWRITVTVTVTVTATCYSHAGEALHL
jgi:hypothetical protein